METFTRERMKAALSRLDELIPQSVTLIVGGGGAMVLGHDISLATSDIDAIPRGMDVQSLDPFVKQVSRELGLPPDWLNPYFSTFAHTLPADYGDRLVEVFTGAKLRALALGKEEMLIMKCFAHRQKDVSHAKALIQRGAEVRQVESHIEALLKKGIPGARDALDFLDDVQEQM